MLPSEQALSDLGLLKHAGLLSSLEHRIDDVGIAVLAAPYAADLTNTGLKKTHNKRLKSLGRTLAKHMGTASAFGKSHARELLGLALVAPVVNKALTKSVARGVSAGRKSLSFGNPFKKIGQMAPLQFDSPEQEAAHNRNKSIAGTAAGIGGSMLGGSAGSMIGGAAGPIGSIGGNILGGALGAQILQKPVETAMDAAHDQRQRAGQQYNKTLGSLNLAAGMPAGRSF